MRSKNKRPRVLSELLYASSSDYKHIRVHVLEKDEEGNRFIYID